MLIIHIGSPKTGTTAIQGFLKVNAQPLADHGVSYLRAGRTNIAHNSMVKPMLKGRAGDIFAAIANEIAASPAKVHFLSSEVFFQAAVAAPLKAGLAGIETDFRVLAYLRRPDLFAEAMYKQKVKNGRIDPDPAAFLESWGGNLHYGPVLDAFRDAFGAGAMRVRPFERQHFPGGDVIADALTIAGVEDASGMARPETPSNKSLSRAVSEHLGRVNRHTGFNTRVMIREIAAAGEVATLRSGDVYNQAQRKQILAETKADQDRIAAEYFAGLEPVYMQDDLNGPDTYPDATEALALERAAGDAVMAAIGRQAAKASAT